MGTLEGCALRAWVGSCGLALALAGCGGGGGGGATPTGGGSGSPGCVASVATGYAADFNATVADAGGDGSGGGSGSGGGAAAGGGFGKVTSALMRVTDLSDNTVLGEALTDPARGLVTVKTCGRSGPFLLTLSGRAGAQYYDEGKDRMLDFGADQSVHALVDRWDEHVGVSPLSEAAYRYALNNFIARPGDIQNGNAPLQTSGEVKGLTAAQVREANGRVRAIANLMNASGYAIESVKTLSTPLDSTSTNAALGNNTYSMSAVVLGGLVKAAAAYNPTLERPALDLTAALARDLTDGRLDGFALDGSAAAADGRQAYPYNAGVPLWTGITNNAIETRFGSASRNVTSQIVDVVPEMTYFKRLPNNQNYQQLYDDPANRITDTAVLMSDGTVRLRRQAGGTNTVDPRFITGVKRIFSSRSPNIMYGPVTTREGSLDRMVQQAYVLKNDGTVWVWGSSSFCLEAFILTGDEAVNNERLARTYIRWSNASDDLPAPIQVPGLRDIVDISVSPYGEKYLARDANGRVFTWGRDVANGWLWRSIGTGEGKLTVATQAYVGGQRVSTTDYSTSNGFVTPSCLTRPVEITGVGQAITVVSAVNANLVLNSRGELYAWGMGRELGLGQELGSIEGVVRVPTRVALPTAGPVRLLSSVAPYVEGQASNMVLLARTFRRQLAASPALGDHFGWGTSVAAPISAQGQMSGVNDNVDAVQVAYASNPRFDVNNDRVLRLGFDGQIVPWSAAERMRDGVPTLEYLSDQYASLPLVHRIKPVNRDVWLFGRDGRVYVYRGLKSTNAQAPEDITVSLLIQ